MHRKLTRGKIDDARADRISEWAIKWQIETTRWLLLGNSGALIALIGLVSKLFEHNVSAEWVYGIMGVSAASFVAGMLVAIRACLEGWETQFELNHQRGGDRWDKAANRHRQFKTICLASTACFTAGCMLSLGCMPFLSLLAHHS